MKPLFFRAQQGFTLIELLTVIIIVSVITASLSTFITDPVKAYFDTNRRADMSDAADTARQSTWFQRFLLPGFAFKAVVIGGGYATGRELAEYFL
ncbi:MAG: type II secretion system protein, partial [Pseudomonadota bacterium]